MPPKKYFSLKEQQAAKAERMAKKRAAEKTGNPNASPKRQKFSKYVLICFTIFKNDFKNIFQYNLGLKQQKEEEKEIEFKCN